MNRPPAPICETVVYCERTWMWHVFNLSSGTVSAKGWESYDAAWQSIKDGEMRAGLTVRRVSMQTIRAALAERYEAQTLLSLHA